MKGSKLNMLSPLTKHMNITATNTMYEITDRKKPLKEMIHRRMQNKILSRMTGATRAQTKEEIAKEQLANNSHMIKILKNELK